MLSGSGGCADASARPLRLTAACELGRGAAGGVAQLLEPQPQTLVGAERRGGSAGGWVGLGQVEG